MHKFAYLYKPSVAETNFGELLELSLEKSAYDIHVQPFRKGRLNPEFPKF